MNITENNIIGELVAKDYRTASIFKKYKIDFCCKGDRTIEQACEKKKVDIENLVTELNKLENSNQSENINFNTWDVDLLIDYIEKKYHRYIREKTPEISAYIKKVALVHGHHRPELLTIRDLFLEGVEDLLSHLEKEEQILFPFAKNLMEQKEFDTPFFGNVNNPINCMKEEHSNEGERYEKIAQLSNNYTPPAEACNTYKVVYAQLQEFEDMLHQHVHLENNILFPKIVELEKAVQYIN